MQDAGKPRHDESTELTLSDLERIRSDTERSIERTRADLERIEALFLALQLRWTKEPTPSSSALTPLVPPRPYDPPPTCL